MFITRATRRDLSDIEEFYRSQLWFEGYQTPDLSQGVAFIARRGPIVGCVRLIEVAPQTVIVEDMVVHSDERGKGLGEQLMRASMNSTGGTLFLCCHDEALDFYRRFGFEELAFESLSPDVQEYMRGTGAWPSPEGHDHYFMSAR
jgi:N-acetylglutamate synthase-like GNAT family acetyltransferase